MQKNWPFMQVHVVVPYMHCMFGDVEHVSPGFGCMVGHGALQCQVVLLPPKAAQRQVVPEKSHWRPSVVHMPPLVGAVVGHVPQDHMPPTQAQSSIP